MWEISTWAVRMQEIKTNWMRIVPFSASTLSFISLFLHSIIGYVPGIVIEYVQGVCSDPVSIFCPEAENIADCVVDAFRTIKAANSRRQYSSA